MPARHAGPARSAAESDQAMSKSKCIRIGGLQQIFFRGATTPANAPTMSAPLGAAMSKQPPWRCLLERG